MHPALTPDIPALDLRRRQLSLAPLAAAAAFAPAGAQATNGSVVLESPGRLQKVQAFFAAYAARDVARVRDLMTPDVSWTIPGHHPLAGTKQGVDEVLAFFDQLARARFQAQPLVMMESGDYVIDHHRGWSEVAGGLDLLWCLVFRFKGERIHDVVNFCANQHVADLFFWKAFPLKSIPARLA